MNFFNKEKKMRTKTLFITILFLLSAALLSACGNLAAQPAVAQGETPIQRTLNVTGKGKATLTPEIAYVTIGVHTEDENASQAVDANNQQSQKVADALKAFQIDAADVQTNNFSIYPQQQYDNEGKFQGIKYVVDNTVFVTLRDIDQLGDLLDAVVEAGANTINSVQFDVEDREAALSEARAAAVADAQKQAQELAKAAGVTLGQVQNINSYGGGTPIPLYDYKGGFGGGAAAAEASVPVSPGQMVLTVEVNMVYEIE